jgi:putative transposase
MALSRAFGCARVVFNDGLRLREQAWLAGEKYVSDGDVQKAVITAAKKTPERAWLGAVSSVVLVQAVSKRLWRRRKTTAYGGCCR